MGYEEWVRDGMDDGADLFMPRDPDTGEPQPNGPDEDEFDDVDQLDEDDEFDPPSVTGTQFFTWLAARHPRRFRRFARDVRWVCDQAVRQGIDPNELGFP